MRTKLTLLSLLFFVFNNLYAQTTIFSENIGAPSVNNIAISANTFQNSGSLLYKQGDQLYGATISIINTSNTYSGASGGGNVYFDPTPRIFGLSIEGINTSDYNNLSLQFAYRKIFPLSHATFSVDYWNGSVWITIANTSSALFNEASNATPGWYRSKQLALPVGAQLGGLKLRFVKSGATIPINIDDIKLTGIPVVPASNSDIVFNSSATTSTNINYELYQ